MTTTSIDRVAGRSAEPARVKVSRKPRLGFVGTGWIGRHRLEAIAASGLAEIVAIADANRNAAAQCQRTAPGAVLASSLDELLELPLDGIVIATPSALHCEQAIAALENGMAVFCQKPLGRDEREVTRIIAAARQANVLLSVDLSYRFVRAVREARKLVQAGELGSIFTIDLVFHNAYGPDKKWFYDPKLSGGGCVIDLGIHLIDLALWILDYPPLHHVSSRLFARGQPIRGRSEVVEDYAVAHFDVEGRATLHLSCSWNLQAGRDAVIAGTFYGTKGGVQFYNVNGSFYDFSADHFRGTTRKPIATPGDKWAGEAAVQWVNQLAAGGGYDPGIETLINVTRALDAIYNA